MSIEGLSVVVTGAGTGIGRSIAERAARSGAKVTLVGRRATALKEVAASASEAMEAVAVDVTDPDAPDRIVAAALGRFGRLDAIVNNAGLARFGPVGETDVAELTAMFEVNVRAPVALIRAALPHLEAGRGSIVNVTSVGGALSMPGRSYYGATKAAQINLLEATPLTISYVARLVRASTLTIKSRDFVTASRRVGSMWTPAPLLNSRW